ncbi:MAG: HD domain-containing protein, partial [Polyangiaceae bacterium]|nr:HD domain-containing protein [Polyangiaceae bacterium]
MNSTGPGVCDRPLEDLLERVLDYQPSADVQLITRAYEFAKEAHAGQKRKSGDPYFTHPVGVAFLVVGLRLDVASIVAALLHDVVEDTSITADDIRLVFGPDVVFLV